MLPSLRTLLLKSDEIGRPRPQPDLSRLDTIFVVVMAPKTPKKRTNAGDSKSVAKTGRKTKPKAKPNPTCIEKAVNIDASMGDAGEIITVTPFICKQFSPEKWRAAKRAIRLKVTGATDEQIKMARDSEGVSLTERVAHELERTAAEGKYIDKD